MEIFNYAAVGALAAALITLTSNWTAHWLARRRAKHSALRRSLYGLIEVLWGLLGLFSIRSLYTGSADSLKNMSNHVLKTSKHRENINRWHSDAVSQLSEHFPVLSFEIRKQSNLLAAVESYAQASQGLHADSIFAFGRRWTMDDYLEALDKVHAGSITEVRNAIEKLLALLPMHEAKAIRRSLAGIENDRKGNRGYSSEPEDGIDTMGRERSK